MHKTPWQKYLPPPSRFEYTSNSSACTQNERLKSQVRFFTLHVKSFRLIPLLQNSNIIIGTLVIVSSCDPIPQRKNICNSFYQRR